MLVVASYIVQHSKDVQKDIDTLSDLLLHEVYDTKGLNDDKKILNIILEWEKKRDKKEPARIEMGRILNKMNLNELAACLNLYN